MEKGKRGELELTLIAQKVRVVKQGLYERDVWDYAFTGSDHRRYEYSGKRHLLFMGKTYRVIATSDGTRFGATHIKRPRFEPVGEKQFALFEG